MIALGLGAAVAAEPAAGRWDGGLWLGVDPATHEVSGVVVRAEGHEVRTGGPRYLCRFGFAGTLDGDAAAVRAVGEERGSTGRLTVAAGAVTLQLDAEPDGGCWRFGRFTEAVRFDTVTPRPWVGVRLVGAPRVALAGTPAGRPRGPVLAYGDVVGVLGAEGGQVHVERVDTRGRVTDGWLAADALAPTP